MMSFSFDNINSLTILEDMNLRIRAALSGTWPEAGQAVIDAIRDEMRATVLGATGHSLPGNYPAVQTGALSASLSYTTSGWEGFNLHANTFYAGFVDMGTARMAARPYLMRGLNDKMKKVEDLVINNVERALLL